MSVHSLARSSAAAFPTLRVGASGLTYLVEVKDGEKRPSHRTLTPDSKASRILKWTGSPVVPLLDPDKALSWACSGYRLP